MVKHTLADLNDLLFEQMERLNADDADQDTLNKEINRSKAMSELAREMISNATVVMKAHMLIEDGAVRTIPEMIGCHNQYRPIATTPTKQIDVVSK